MPLFVEVMYTDRDGTGEFRQVRVSARPATVSALQRTDVLFIILSAETAGAKSRRVIGGRHYRRRYQMHDEDHYAIVFRGDEVLCWQWSDREFNYVSLGDPDADSRIKRSQPPQMPVGAIVFSAPDVALPGEEWEGARVQFEARMH